MGGESGAHLLDGWGARHPAAEVVFSQVQIVVAKGTEGSWPAHHLVQLQAHQTRHSRGTGSNGWDNLAHDSLALSRTRDLVWAQDVGLDFDPDLQAGAPAGLPGRG